MKFIFINKDDTSFTEYNFRKLYFVPIVLLLIALVTVPSIYFYLKYEDAEKTKFIFIEKEKEIEQEYEGKFKELKGTISEYENIIKGIENNLDNLHEKDDSIRDIIGLPLIPDDIRKMGTGGEKKSDDESSMFDDERINQFVALVDSLGRVSKLQEISYAKIDDYVEENLSKILRIPFAYPVNIEDCKVTSKYGMRLHPTLKKKHMHEGQDFAPITGSFWKNEVYATADGIVKKSIELPRTYGNYIEIDHGNGIVTAYAHLRLRDVKKGQKVRRGQFIGYMGNSGLSTSVHLHYEIKKNGKSIDPQKYFFDTKSL